MHVGEAGIPVGVAEVEFFVIEAELVENGGMQAVHVNFECPALSRSPDRRSEGTVHLIIGREAVAEFDGFEAGRVFEDASDELLVFGGFDAAGAINEDATGFEDAEAVFEKLCLGLHLRGDVIGLQTPADIDAAAHDAGVGAGDVEQDAVKAGLGEGGDLRL